MKTRLLSFIFCVAIFPLSAAVAERAGEDVAAQAERYWQDTEKRKEAGKEKARLPEIEVEREKEVPAAKGLSFVLKDVIITGSTVFKTDYFRPVYQPYLGKKVSFKELEEISAKVRASYKEKGYLTTTVYLPEQEVVSGRIEIRIVEGKMGELRVEGNKWFAGNVLKKYFHTGGLEVLNMKKLQRDILRLNQNPDLEVRTVISTGEMPETSDIILTVKERMPYHFGVGFDNQGTRLVGRYRESVWLRSSNLSGNLDSLYVGTLLSSKALGESISYQFPVTTYGTKIGLDITHFNTKLGKEFKAFDIIGNTQMYTPHISQELYLSEDFQADVDTGIEIKSVKKKMSGETTVKDELRLPYICFNFLKRHSFLATSVFTPRITFGVKDFLGASARNHPNAGRPGTEAPFVKYEQFLRHMRKMPFESYVTARSQFQIPTRALPSSEQLQLGGANSIRGYPEGDYLADFGGSLNLDWAFASYWIPKYWKLPGQEMPLRYQIEPVVFVDAGGGKLKKTFPGEERYKFLLGAGGGLRINFSGNISLRLEWAKHLGDKPTGGAGPSTFHLTFQSEL